MRLINYILIGSLLSPMTSFEQVKTFQPQAVPTDLEIVTSVQSPDPSGIAISKEGRIFLGFPRHADNHKSFALTELVNGKLEIFPNKDFVYPSTKPFNEWLVSPHGMTFDSNNILWVLDDGKRAGIKEIPEGAAKVVGIDIHSKKVIASIVIPHEIMGDDAHLNDLRVDLTHGKKGTVYIANSGFGPHYSLFVVDIASGKVREVLKNHPSTSPDPGYMTFLEYQPKVFATQKSTFPSGGADGIALGKDSKKLYWTAISGRNLYSLNTDIISNFDLSEGEIEKAVQFEGQHPSCDGFDSDEEGNLYFGAFEQKSIVKRDISGSYKLLTHNPLLIWPDGVCYHDGYVYVTLGQWNRMASMNGGKELRQPPYQLVRVKAK